VAMVFDVSFERGPTRRHSGKRSSWPNSRSHGSLMNHVSKLCRAIYEASGHLSLQYDTGAC